MKNYVLIVLAGCLVLTTSCKKKNSGDDTITSGLSVETNPPKSSYRPAFDGQKRVGAVRTTTDYSNRVITSALNGPWGIAALPDGWFLIKENQFKLLKREM